MSERKSEYIFRRELPEMAGYGPGLAVVLRSNEWFLGYVRKILEPEARGGNWAIYRRDGSEAGVADLRSTAASWLRHEATRNSPVEVQR